MLHYLRIALHIIVFLWVVFIGDRVGSRCIDHAVMSTQFRYSQLYQGQLPADIVVIGNSRGLHMFHPPAMNEVAGLRAANLSFNALPTVLMPALWHDYLTHHEAPQRLLFEISCVSRADETGAMERFTTYMSHSPQVTSVIATYRPSEYWAAQFSHLYRFNNEFTLRSMFFRNRSDQDWIMQSTATAETIDHMLGFGAEEILYSREHVDAARRILSLAVQNDVQVELIVGPFHPRYRAAIPQLSDWIAWLERQLDCSIHDYSQAITDDQAFADHMHLNAQGASAFAKLLLRDGLL